MLCLLLEEYAPSTELAGPGAPEPRPPPPAANSMPLRASRMRNRWFGCKD